MTQRQKQYYWLKIKESVKQLTSAGKAKKLLQIKFLKLRLKSFILAVVGFMLSPLSWWNDLFINIPLAYAFAVPFGIISENWFLPAMVIGYWLTNIIGFVLLHMGVIGLFKKEQHTYTRKQLVKDISISVFYTIIVVILVEFNILRLPFEYF